MGMDEVMASPPQHVMDVEKAEFKEAEFGSSTKESPSIHLYWTKIKLWFTYYFLEGQYLEKGTAEKLQSDDCPW